MAVTTAGGVVPATAVTTTGEPICVPAAVVQAVGDASGPQT